MSKLILLFPMLVALISLGYDLSRKPRIDKKRATLIGMVLAVLIFLGGLNIFFNGEYTQKGYLGNPLPERNDIVCTVETYCDGFSFSQKCLGAWRDVCAPQTLKTQVHSSQSK